MGVLRKSKALALAMVSSLLLVAGVVSASAQSSARTSTSRGAERVLVSRGFLVYNLSSHSIKLINVTGDNHFEGRTPDGSILEAKSAFHRFEVQVRFLTTQRNTAHYAILGDQGQEIGTFDVHMEVLSELLGAIVQTSRCETSIGTCAISPAHDVITLFDHAGRLGTR